MKSQFHYFKNLGVIIFMCWLILVQQSVAIDQFISVTFTNKVNDKFIEVINLMIGTTIYEKEGDFKYKFKIPNMHTIDEYAELFYFLPYVKEVYPFPKQKWEDTIEPLIFKYQKGPANLVPNSQQPYIEGEILVKFKNNTTPQDISFLNEQYNTSVTEIINGINVYRLKLPEGIDVLQGLDMYKQNDIVEYVEPNYRISLTDPVSVPSSSPSSLNNQNDVHVLTRIPVTEGTEIFIDYKAGIAPVIPALFNLIFETKLIEQRTSNSYRLRLPPNVKPQTASRIYKLCPYVINVEPTYGR